MFKKFCTTGVAIACMATFGFVSCSDSNDAVNQDAARVQIRLTDAPIDDLAGVYVDIQDIKITRSDTAGWVSLANVHPGVYNLLDFTNGHDTLLSDATIPAGQLSQIRLILGSNNYVVTNSGQQIPLSTPSAQQSGLKVQVQQNLTGGVLYRLVLDFDAARSVFRAGNSGQYILKPVLRLLSFTPSGGNVKGYVLPDSVRTAVYALQGTDTISSTFTQSPVSGSYLFSDIPAGNYSFSFVPQDSIHQPASRNVSVLLGQSTVVDTVRLAP